MKRTWLKWGAIAIFALAPAATALARQDTPDREIVDGRLEGYANTLSLPPSGTALTWFAWVFLGILCLGGLFKDAKRSHLD